jgi:hypothetical protein
MIIGTVRMQINGQWCDVTGLNPYDPREERPITVAKLREILEEHRKQTIEEIVSGLQRGKCRGIL